MTKEDIEKYADVLYPHAQVIDRNAVAHDAFVKGALWMQEQFENNRLEHCERLSPDEAKREMDFITAFIKEHDRTPTFSDCIELTREELIEKACEWLSENADKYSRSSLTDIDRYLWVDVHIVEDFKKAMEE